MTILITGGAGYIGTVLVEMIIYMIPGCRVIVYDNLMYKQDGIFPLLINKQIQFVYGDVRDHNHLDKYLKQADVVIPLAAIVGMPACKKDPRLAEDVNWRQLQFIADEAPYGCRIIIPNSNSGYGASTDGKPCTEESPINPISVYGQTKCLGEKAVMEAGEHVAFRLATVFGTSYRFRKDLLVNDFVLKAMTDKYIVLFESHFKRNFIHVRDVCSAICMAIGQWGEFCGQVFNVGLSSANLSKLELCKVIQKFIPEFVIKQDEFATDADQRNYIVSNAKLEATGWLPEFTLEDGIQELIEAYPVLINSQTKYTNL